MSQSINESTVFPNQIIVQAYGDESVSSDSFDIGFINSYRIPAHIKKKLEDPKLAEAILKQELPIDEITVTKPYWGKGVNKRPYTKLHFQIFGSVCLVDDKTILDYIIAGGNQFDLLQPESLRTLADIQELNVEWDLFLTPRIIDEPVPFGRLQYFHITYKKLAELIGRDNNKTTRTSINLSLQRLATSIRKVTALDANNNKIYQDTIQFTQHDAIFNLTDMTNIRNKKQVNKETFTDLIIGVSQVYLATLQSEGVPRLTRKRILNVYPHFNGKHGVDDFIKSLETHQSEFLHGKMLKRFIEEYVEQKSYSPGINKSSKIRSLSDEVLKLKHLLLTHLKLLLKPIKGRNGRIEHQLIFTSNISKQEAEAIFSEFYVDLSL